MQYVAKSTYLVNVVDFEEIFEFHFVEGQRYKLGKIDLFRDFDMIKLSYVDQGK